MMDRPIEAKLAEIDVELKNLGAEMHSLWVALEAGERCITDARMKFHAIQDRRHSICSLSAQLRAEVRRSQ